MMTRSFLFILLALPYAEMQSTGDMCPMRCCCDGECCGNGTMYSDGNCIADPTSAGWDGMFGTNYVEGCAYRGCCGGDCCAPGTVFNNATCYCEPEVVMPNCTVTSQSCCPVGDSCIGGIVAIDVDGDGLGGPSGDVGTPLVTLEWLDDSGVVIGTLMTDENGCFRIDTTGFGPFATGIANFAVVITNNPGGIDSDSDGGDPNTIIVPNLPGGGADPTNHCLWFLKIL